MLTEQSVKSLLRRIVVFQSWRLAEPPFENHPDIYKPDDFNRLIDDAVSALTEYASVLRTVNAPQLFKPSGSEQCACTTASKTDKKDKHNSDAKSYGFIQP